MMKYGDYDNVTKDVKTLNNIIDRQGITLLIEVIAEYVGQKNIDFKFDRDIIESVKDSILDELKQAINERI